MRYNEASMYMSLAQNTETRINSYAVEKVIGTYCHECSPVTYHEIVYMEEIINPHQPP
jgi:hypothetical protein